LNPQAWNRFSYVYNNPASYVDPNGQFAVPAILLVAAVGFLGGEIYAVSHGYDPLAPEFWYYSVGGAVAATSLYFLAADLAIVAGWGLQGVGLWTGSTTAFGWGLTATSVGAGMYAWAFQPLDFRLGGSVAREAAIRRVLKQQGMEMPSTVESITYDPALNRSGRTTPLEGGRTAITIGPKAFSSKSQLASTLGHELVHARQVFEEEAGIRVYDWAGWEMEAYGWEIVNAYRTGLSGKEFEEVFQKWQEYRDLWARHHG
ncbi:MAG: hypothetical protein SVX38_11160, partial [Chloroflexota bacterium]|nr:hypothetical protein [Chloroflexota bacterium]